MLLHGLMSKNRHKRDAYRMKDADTLRLLLSAFKLYGLRMRIIKTQM